MAIPLFESCSVCGALLILSDDGRNHVVRCPDCYDPVPDAASAEHVVGRGATPEDALEDYFDARADAGLEPEYRPSELLSFVVPRSPEGWGLSPDSKQPAVLFYQSLTQAERLHKGVPAPLYYGPVNRD